MDIIRPERRSALMSRIRGRDTAIEITVRKGLHRLGFRYRLGGGGLPGRSNVVLPKYGTVVFAHGCFWHGHECPLYRLPKTRTAFWRAKVEGNHERDARKTTELRAAGWKVETVWECQIRGKSPEVVETLTSRLGRKILKRGGRSDFAARHRRG